MRTAAIGLAFLRDPSRLAQEVASISRITHRDSRSVAGGVAIAEAARRLASEAVIIAEPFCDAIAEVVRPIDPAFSDLFRELATRLGGDRDETISWMAWAGSLRPEFSRPIITPFVVPTVLASIWALLRHLDSWGDAVAGAIGLGGDVDTLGAIVGALAGVRLGVQSIPAPLVEGVSNSAEICTLAHRFFLLIARE